MKGILPDDGRHDKDDGGFVPTAEWCEGCKQTLPLDSTIYVEEKRKWLCEECRKEK